MGSPLDCTIDRHFPLVTVHLRGVLDLTTATRVRLILLKCLAEQPAAILVDLTAMDVGETVTLTVFLTAARHAAAWPGIPIVLYGARPKVAAALTRMGLGRHVGVCATADEARRNAARDGCQNRIRDRFPGTAEGVRGARHLAAGACHRWGLAGLAPTASLVAGEIAGNAARYAGTDVDVTVTRFGRYLHIAVRDGSSIVPEQTGPAGGTSGFGGRGLMLLEVLTASWGWTPTVNGKVVWATLAVRPEITGARPGDRRRPGRRGRGSRPAPGPP